MPATHSRCPCPKETCQGKGGLVSRQYIWRHMSQCGVILPSLEEDETSSVADEEDANSFSGEDESSSSEEDENSSVSSADDNSVRGQLFSLEVAEQVARGVTNKQGVNHLLKLVQKYYAPALKAGYSIPPSWYMVEKTFTDNSEYTPLPFSNHHCPVCDRRFDPDDESIIACDGPLLTRKNKAIAGTAGKCPGRRFDRKGHPNRITVWFDLDHRLRHRLQQPDGRDFLSSIGRRIRATPGARASKRRLECAADGDIVRDLYFECNEDVRDRVMFITQVLAVIIIYS